MSDNVPITAGSGTNIASDDISSVQYQRAKLIHGADGTNDGDVSSSNPLPTLPLPRVLSVTASAYTRQANTTAYAANDAVSDNATAGSVTAISFTFADINDAPIRIDACVMKSTDTGVAGGTFRLYLFNSDPTASSGVGGGDNIAWSQKLAGAIGILEGTFWTFSDGSVAFMSPVNVPFILAKPSSGGKIIYGLLQTVAAFTPSANSTTFTPTLLGSQGRA